MEWWQAVFLGVVEGFTEYLPVSSTGHLILAQRALGIEEGGAANAYAICIQAGAIVAVLGLYAGRLREMLRGIMGRDADGARLALAVVVAFLPAACVGLLAADAIDDLLFGLPPVVGAWLVGGLGILAVARWQRGRGSESGASLVELGVRGALVIGLCQCLALWPGTSRSLVTIVGGLLVGLSLSAAVEFSFLLGVVTLLAATAYKGFDAGPQMMQSYGPLALVLGTLAAWAAAVVSVRLMVSWLSEHGLQIFGWYRIALALVVGALLVQGVL
jgi:undecaprenyl-diphosphatase